MRRHRKERDPAGRAVILLLLFLLLAAAHCSRVRSPDRADSSAEAPDLPPQEEQADLPPDSTADYIIGTGDLMNVLIYGEPDLTGMVRVSNEGFIELPLIGKVRASGLTAPELKQSIEHRLREGYLVRPDVQIILQEYRQDVVHLMGQVATPGPYRITHNNTLMSTISQAGGFTPIAKRNKVKIIRKENGKSRVFFVDTLSITRQGRLQEDVLLKPGDVVIVPERFF